ncbi:MAG: HAMP domain-containing sensor histidine kinase [Chloroflexota bacterium]
MDEQQIAQLVAARRHQNFLNTLKPASAIFSTLILLIALVFYFVFSLTGAGLLFFAVAIIYIAINIGIRWRTPTPNVLLVLTVIMLIIPVTLLYSYFYTTEVYRTLIFVASVIFAGSFYVPNKRAFQLSVAIFALELVAIIFLLGGSEPLRAAVGLSTVFVVALILNSDHVNNLERIERFRVRDELAQETLKDEINERQEAQRALAEAYTTVEQQVAERTEALNQALAREQGLYAKLEETLAQETQLQQMKTDIIANVSHEFRTPLNIISMSTDILMEHNERLTAVKRERYRSNVREQIFYMTDMLQDIFFINSSEAVELKQERFAFAALGQQLEADLRRAVENSAANVAFEYPSDEAELVTDYTHLQRLIFNLLSNAIKFSDEGELVRVALGRNGRFFTIQVSDSGIGIPPADQDRIFELFYRGSNIETRRGLGLGLGIVQTIVNAFEGTITVQSAGHQQGTTFSVSLPVVAPPDSSN